MFMCMCMYVVHHVAIVAFVFICTRAGILLLFEFVSVFDFYIYVHMCKYTYTDTDIHINMCMQKLIHVRMHSCSNVRIQTFETVCGAP